MNLKLWVSIILNINVCTYHFVASTDKNGYSPGVFTLLDDQHAIFCGTKGDLLYQTSQAKFLWRQLTEPWYDPTPCSYSNQLQREKMQKCNINSSQTSLHHIQIQI